MNEEISSKIYDAAYQQGAIDCRNGKVYNLEHEQMEVGLSCWPRKITVLSDGTKETTYGFFGRRSGDRNIKV